MWPQYICYGVLSALVVILVIVLGISPRSRFGPPPHVRPAEEEKSGEISYDGTTKREERR